MDGIYSGTEAVMIYTAIRTAGMKCKLKGIGRRK